MENKIVITAELAANMSPDRLLNEYRDALVRLAGSKLCNSAHFRLYNWHMSKVVEATAVVEILETELKCRLSQAEPAPKQIAIFKEVASSHNHSNSADLAAVTGEA